MSIQREGIPLADLPASSAADRRQHETRARERARTAAAQRLAARAFRQPARVQAPARREPTAEELAREMIANHARLTGRAT